MKIIVNLLMVYNDILHEWADRNNIDLSKIQRNYGGKNGKKL